MTPIIGDIVKGMASSPYIITKGDFHWCVVGTFNDENGNRILQITSVPANLQEFEKIQSLLGDSLLKRRKRFDLGIKVFHVDPIYFETVGKIGSNLKFKHLLEQGDVWESKSIQIKDNFYTVELPWE